MSFSASGQGSSPPTAWEDFTEDRKDNPPPYTREPIFEGSYVDDEDFLSSRHNLNRADCSDSIEGGFTNPAFQNPPQNPQYAPCPQNPAHCHQLQQDQQPSQYIAPYQPDYGAYGPPPKYTAHQNDANATLGYVPPPPHGMQATGQQSAYDPRSSGVYPPSATGQCVVAQPQGFGGQPSAITVNPILEDPPNDHMGYSIFVTLCCCWVIGFFAIFKSFECRRAIDVGNHELAKKKSNGARNVAHAALALGILVYIVAAVILGISLC